MFQWNDRLDTGIVRIDADHIVLVALINQVIINTDSGGVAALRHVVEALKGYVAYHFGYEEQLMAECDYPGRQEHMAQHCALRDRLGEMADKHSEIGAREMRNFLVGWLTEHIAEQDRKLGVWVKDAHLRPPESARPLATIRFAND